MMHCHRHSSSLSIPIWCSSLAAFAILAIAASPTHAQLRFFYDPASGNVAVDTSQTRTGYSHSYHMDIDTRHVPWRFRPENQIRLSTSQYFRALPDTLSDFSHDEPFRGLYTIGEVFPTGLAPQDLSVINTSYADLVGGGSPPPAEFVYGPPEGEFVNKWDLIDPNTLDWATTAKLVYRAWNGEVLIDTTGSSSGYIASFRLVSSGGIIAENYTPFLDVTLTGVEGDTVYMFADAIEPGVHSIGHILPSGLSSSQFDAAFDEAKFLSKIGFQQGSFDFDTDGLAMTLQFVPEPCSFLLLMAGFLCGVWPLCRLDRTSCCAA